MSKYIFLSWFLVTSISLLGGSTMYVSKASLLRLMVKFVSPDCPHHRQLAPFLHIFLLLSAPRITFSSPSLLAVQCCRYRQWGGAYSRNMALDAGTGSIGRDHSTSGGSGDELAADCAAAAVDRCSCTKPED